MFQTQEADTDEGEEKMTEEDESERDAVGGERKNLCERQNKLHHS